MSLIEYEGAPVGFPAFVDDGKGGGGRPVGTGTSICVGAAVSGILNGIEVGDSVDLATGAAAADAGIGGVGEITAAVIIGSYLRQPAAKVAKVIVNRARSNA